MGVNLHVEVEPLPIQCPHVQMQENLKDYHVEWYRKFLSSARPSRKLDNLKSILLFICLCGYVAKAILQTVLGIQKMKVRTNILFHYFHKSIALFDLNILIPFFIFIEEGQELASVNDFKCMTENDL